MLGPKTATSRCRSASRTSDVESRVGLSCTVREQHCTTSSSFSTCKISHGDAERKGFVKCTVLRGGRIGPLRCQRSHVVLGMHIQILKITEKSGDLQRLPCNATRTRLSLTKHPNLNAVNEFHHRGHARRLFTMVHSNQDLILAVKTAVYMVFWLHRGSGYSFFR